MTHSELRQNYPILSVRKNRARILNQPVFEGDMEAALLRIGELADTDAPHLVVTANIDHIIDLHDRTPLVDAYEQASIRTVDGTPVLWTLRALGATNLSRVTGADLIGEVVRRSELTRWKVAITGGAPEVLEEAVQRLTALYPSAQIQAIPMPLLTSADDQKGYESVRLLQAFQPEVVFLCLGAPKQESWFMHWKADLPAAVYIGAGAAVDFAAGTKRRAPRLAQQLGLEWVWRVSQEFSRLAPRYMYKGPRYVQVILKSFRARNRG